MKTIQANPIARYTAIAAISAAPLTVVAYLCAQQWCYVAAAVLVLCLKDYLKLAVSLVAYLLFGMYFLSFTPMLFPHTYDAALLHIDAAMGYHPLTVILTLESMPVIRGIAKVVYLAFPLAIALATVLSKSGQRFFVKMAASTAIAFTISIMIPACGPLYLFTSALATAPRNSVPSAHTMWALMVWYELREQSLFVRLCADVFLMFTIIATLGSGEHYITDLIAAVPFWLAAEWANVKLGSSLNIARWKYLPATALRPVSGGS